MLGVHILCVFPLSGVTARGLNAPAEAMYTDIQRVGEEFIKSVEKTYPRCKNFPFSSIRWKDKYGRLSHIKHLEDDMVDVAREIYVYLCENRKSLHKVYVVAVESGAFMVARLLEFIKIYGLNCELGLVDFPRLWGALIANRGPEHPPSPPENHLDSEVFEQVILIRPCLPVPRGCASFWWGIIGPKFYKHLVFKPEELPCKTLFWVNGGSNPELFIDMVMESRGKNVVEISNPDAMVELLEGMQDKAHE